MIVIEDARTARMDLQQLIRHVKTDLLAYQKEHRGEPALFDIQEVTVEATVGTTIEPNGTVKLVVVDLGAKATQATTHKVTIKLAITKQNEPARPPVKIGMLPDGGSSSSGDGGDGGSDDGGGFSRQFGRPTALNLSGQKGRKFRPGKRTGYVRPFGYQVRLRDFTKGTKNRPITGEGEAQMM